MAGPCAPLSTLRPCPRGHLRMTRGRCGSLLLHRDGLAPSTPCRSPGALRFTPESEHRAIRLVPQAGVTFVRQTHLAGYKPAHFTAMGALPPDPSECITCRNLIPLA